MMGIATCACGEGGIATVTAHGSIAALRLKRRCKDDIVVVVEAASGAGPQAARRLEAAGARQWLRG